MKKKFLALTMAAAMAVTMMGCSKPAETTKSSKTAVAETSAKVSSASSTTTTGSTVSTEPVSEKVVTAAIPSAWTDLFPLGEGSHYDNIVLGQVYDVLVKQNGDGSFTGQLAESWEVNAESTEIKFKLKSGVKWHNGDAFSAEDIVESFRIYSDSNVKATSRYYLQHIDGCDKSGVETAENSIAVSAPSENELVIKLKAPTYIDTVLDDLSHVYVIQGTKLKDLSAEDVNKAETWAKPNGTGAFVFAGAVDGERVEFTANKEYHTNPAEFDKLVIRVVASANVLAGLMNGEIDAVIYGGVPLDDWKLAREQANLICESAKSQSYQLLVINTTKDYLSQKVRQAISMAIDRKSLVDQLLQGEGEPIVTPISSKNQYYNKDVEVWYDVEKAKALLAEANFPADQVLKFYVPTGNAMREKAAAIIAENLKSVGIQTEIVQVDFPAFMEAAKNGGQDIGIIGSGGSMNPSESLEMLQGEFNLCQLPEDNELAALLMKGNSTLTKEERVPIFNEFQVKMREITPYAYIFTTNSLVAYNKRLSNVDVTKFSTFNWEMNKWKVSE